MEACSRHLPRPVGAPVIWGNPYQMGAMFFGGVRDFDSDSR